MNTYFLTARTVFEMGIPTPEPYRLVTDGERYGAEYELIKNKRSFARIISEEPERLEEISLTFANIARELHTCKANTARLHSFKQTLIRFYQEKDRVPEEFKRRALAFIEKVPEADTCLHGDLQIGNIITNGDRTDYLFHITPETFTKHWDIFLPAYLGTTDPNALEAYTRRLFPFYAAKVPYMVDMAVHTSFSAEALERIIKMLPNV